jgi:hypothetical protein
MSIERVVHVECILNPVKKTLNFDSQKGDIVSYSGHFIQVKYNISTSKQIVYMDDREDVDARGMFTLQLPDKNVVQTPLLIEVYAPDGELLYHNSYNYSALTAKTDKPLFTIDVDPKEIGISKPQSIIIHGQLVDSSAIKQMANAQVIIWASNGTKAKFDIADYTPVATCNTKLNGKFFTQVPNKEFKNAYISITGINELYIPIRIDEVSNKIADDQLVIYDFSNVDTKDFRDTLTTLPDHDELTSSTQFSQDVGGKCVDFTVPNRTLDEFSFYHVVRTTEPEIKKNDFTKRDSDDSKDVLFNVSKNAFLEFDKLVDSFESIVPIKIEALEDDTEQTDDNDPQPSDSDVAYKCPQIEDFNKIVDVCNSITNRADKKTFQTLFVQIFKTPCKHLDKALPEAKCKELVEMLAVANKDKNFLKIFKKYYQKTALTSHLNTIKKVAVTPKENFATASMKMANIFQTKVVSFNKVPIELDDLKQEFNIKTNVALMRIINMHKEHVKKLEELQTKLRLAFCAKNGYSNIQEYCNSMYQENDDYCIEDTKEVHGLLCVKQEFERIRNKIDNQAILSLDEILEIQEYCKIFIHSIDNFLALLEEFSHLHENFVFVNITNKYFIKNYINIQKRLEKYKVDIVILEQKMNAYYIRYVKNHPGRQELSVEVEIDWDDTPTIYQNTTIAHGHILHFKQKWKADGYSLGDLLYSLPLAPCQEKQIAILDWDRTESGSRAEEQVVYDTVDAIISHDRDIHETASSIFNESIHASSINKTSSTSGGFGAGLGGVFSGGVFGIGGGVSHSGASSSSTATQDSSRNLSANSMQALRDTTQQSASSMRSSRSAAIETIGQNETVSAQTEVIKNHSHCHSMTVEYFQVLRHYAVEEELVDVQECLFVPLPMTLFDHKKVLRWKNTLGSTINSKQLRKGFGAIERIESNYENSNLPNGIYAKDRIDEFSGYFDITFDFTRPEIDEIEEATKEELVVEVYKLDRWFPWFNHTWRVTRKVDVPLDDDEKNEIFEKQYAPEIARTFIDTLAVYGVNEKGKEVDLELDLTMVTNYKKNRRIRVQIASGEANQEITREEIKYLFIRAKKEVRTASSKIILRTFNLHYKTKHLNETITRKYSLNNDVINVHEDDSNTTVTDSALIYTPMNKREMTNPKQEDKEAAATLVNFLNEHLELAHNAIWSHMDKSRLFGLLDGYIAPNSQSKSVASVVENKVMGVVGNNLVLKVSPGYKLDPLYKNVDLFEHYQPTTKPDAYRISVPTRGVYSEAVLGKCNSCEEIDESRFWRFNDVPCGTTPTAITPLSTETRRAQPSNLQTQEMPTSLINMQTAPSAPDPTGLGALYTLMGNGNSFKDMTGLEGTQANALGALKTTSQSVTDLTNIAKDFASLAVMQDSKQSTPKEINEIKKLKEEGYLSDDEAKELIKQKLGAKQQAVDTITNNDKKKTDGVVQSTVDKAIGKGIIDKGSSFEIEGKDGEKVKVDNSKKDVTNISATTVADNEDEETDAEYIDMDQLPDAIV